MAGNGNQKIRGITIELDGDASGLMKSLSDIGKSLRSTQSQLNDVNKLLKLDPGNMELIAQKQRYLGEMTEQTAEKLEKQKEVLAQLKEQAAKGVDNTDQQNAMQREIIQTTKSLEKLKDDLRNLDSGSGVDEITEDMRDVEQSAERAAQSISEMDNAAEPAADSMQDMADAADKMQESIDEAGETLKSSAFMDASEKLSGVADKIVEIGKASMDEFNETENATRKAVSYFGETGTAAEETADIIQDVYGNGVGDSMDTVADSVITVKKNFEDLSKADLTHLTEIGTTLEESYGIDLSETMRGVNSLMEQFGLTSAEALDYVVKGTQNGLDKTDELGDNLSEYAGKFAQAGYSAGEYFQLLSNGLDNGAYNLDKVNDAINEVTNRIADGTIEKNLDSYSDQTKQFFEAWKNGNGTQKDVIDSIVNDISNATTQQDKLNLATTAFGTMAEDGSLKFITALTSVGDTYKDVTGAATDFYNQSTTPAQMLEANLRTLRQALVPIGEALMTGLNTVLPPITTAVKFLATIFGAMPDSMKAFVAILAGLLVAMAKIAPIITAISVANTALNISLGPVLLIILAIAAAIAAVIAVVKHWDTISTWLSDTWNTLAEDAQITWDNISTFWSDTWDTIKEKASQTWENISEGAAIFWNNFSTFWANFGLTIYTSTASAWESVKTYLSSTWNNLVTFGAASFLTLRNSVSTTWSNIKSQTSATWDNVKSTISNAMGNAYSTVSSHASSMYSAVSTQFSNIVSSAASAAVGVYNHIYSGFESAWSYITGLPAKAFQWGSDLIDGFVGGIESFIHKVHEAAGEVADIIKQYIHFSRPDIGPLRDYEKWMPDMMQGLADGIRQNQYLVANAMQGLAGTMAIAAPSVPISTQSMAIDTNGISSAIRSALAAGQYSGDTGDTIIPIYLDGSKIYQAVVTQEQRMKYRSGGR